jgi:hypothetical protein
MWTSKWVTNECIAILMHQMGFSQQQLGGITFQSGFTLQVSCAYVRAMCFSSG